MGEWLAGQFVGQPSAENVFLEFSWFSPYIYYPLVSPTPLPTQDFKRFVQYISFNVFQRVRILFVCID